MLVHTCLSCTAAMSHFFPLGGAYICAWGSGMLWLLNMSEAMCFNVRTRVRTTVGVVSATFRAIVPFSLLVKTTLGVVSVKFWDFRVVLA